MGTLWSFLKEVKTLVLYDVDREMVMEPMHRNLASSQFVLGYTKLFCIPEVTSVFYSSCDSVLRDSGFQSSISRLLTCLIVNLELLCLQYCGLWPQLSPSGKSHGFSRVAAGTWDIFSIYSADVHSKLQFVQ